LDEPQATMKTRKTYTGEFKVAVVLELLCGRKSLADLAALYELHPNQIKNWKSRLLKQAIYIFDDKRRKARQAK
jgi:transposase-like protein